MGIEEADEEGREEGRYAREGDLGLVISAGELCFRKCTRAAAQRLGSFWSLPPCVVAYHGGNFALVSS